MEWKIGEIKQVNGEWYQCVVAIQGCRECSFRTQDYCTRHSECLSEVRSDGMSVIFKKLEKVGESYTTFVDKTVQNYLLETAVSVPPKDVFTLINNEQRLIAIEIKQNKEDMEEKGQCCDNRFEIIAKAKEALLKETNIARDEQEMAVIDNILFRCWQMGWLDKYDDTKHSDSESIGKNLNPLSLEAAKAGKPVCTRGGRKARIIYFDAKGDYPIVALIETENGERVGQYMIDGHCTDIISQCCDDLMMLPEKKEGWVNIYVLNTCYPSKEEAEANIDRDYEHEYVRTVKINWEE